MWRSIFLLFLFLSIAPLAAQDEPVITPENAVHLIEIGYVGGALPGNLAWSPDGQTLAIGTLDGVKLYTPADDMLRELGGGSMDVNFGVEGEVVISGDQAWNVETGERTELPQDKSAYFDTYYNDAQELEVIVNHPEIGTLRTLSTGLQARLLAGVVAPELDFAAVALLPPEGDIIVQLWYLESVSLSFIFTPDSTKITGYNGENRIDIWDVESGEIVHTFEIERGMSVAFSPDGRWLLTEGRGLQSAGLPKTLWDVETGEIYFQAPTEALINADGSMLAYWVDGAVRIVDLETLETHDLTVLDQYSSDLMAFSAVRGWAVFSGLSIMDVTTGEQVETLPDSSTAFFSPDGSRLGLILIEQRNTLQVWDTADMQAPIIEIRNAYGDHLLFSPDNRLIAALWKGHPREENGGSEVLWVVETGRPIGLWRLRDHSDNHHAFSPDSQTLVTGYRDNAIAFWKMGKPLAYEATPATEYTLTPFSDTASLMFSPDGRHLAATVLFKNHPYEPVQTVTVHLWRDLERETLFPNAELIGFDPTSTYLVTKDLTAALIQLWDVVTGEEIAAVAGGKVTAFSPDGSLLVTYTGNQLLVWDVNALDTPLIRLENDDYLVREIAFNPDGTRLYVVGAVGVRIYGIGDT
jgi:WD40 repeat protein